MSPILASILFVVPILVLALGIACVVGAVAVVLRVRTLAVLSGATCVVVAIFSFVFLRSAREEEVLLTGALGTISLIAAIALIFLKRKPKELEVSCDTVEFEPRWKEELVGKMDGKKFVLVLTMGEFHVFLPSRTTWEASAPDWARNQWERVHGELEAWCKRKKIPLTVEDHASVEFE